MWWRCCTRHCTMYIYEIWIYEICNLRLGRQAVEVGGFKCGEDVWEIYGRNMGWDITRGTYLRYEYMRYVGHLRLDRQADEVGDFKCGVDVWEWYENDMWAIWDEKKIVFRQILYIQAIQCVTPNRRYTIGSAGFSQLMLCLNYFHLFVFLSKYPFYRSDIPYCWRRQWWLCQGMTSTFSSCIFSSYQGLLFVLYNFLSQATAHIPYSFTVELPDTGDKMILLCQIWSACPSS